MEKKIYFSFVGACFSFFHIDTLSIVGDGTKRAANVTRRKKSILNRKFFEK